MGDEAASGTEIVARLGAEHEATGRPILYTSADSVVQIAAHEGSFGLDRLMAVCRTARAWLDGSGLNVGRVIARPFAGAPGAPGAYARTGNRRDLAVPPPEPTVLDRAKAAGRGVIAVGKIADIFAHSGVTDERHASGNDALTDATLAAMADAGEGDLTVTNFVDFDMLYGHRRDVAGYAAALEAFDRRLPEIEAQLQGGRHAGADRRPRLRPDLAGHRPHARARAGAGVGAGHRAAHAAPRAQLCRHRRDGGRASGPGARRARDAPAVSGAAPTPASIPKAEMHVHLEACARPPLARAMATRYGAAIDDAIAADGASYRWEGFTGFLAAYSRVADLFRTSDDYAELAETYLDELAGGGHGVRGDHCVARPSRAAGPAGGRLPGRHRAGHRAPPRGPRGSGPSRRGCS